MFLIVGVAVAFVGLPPPPSARFSASPLGDDVLVLVPPVSEGRGRAALGANGEPGTAMYMLAADGWTDAELQLKYRRVRLQEVASSGVGDALLQVAGLEPSDEYIDF